MKSDDLIQRLDKVAPAKPKKTQAQLQTEEQEAAQFARWFELAMRDEREPWGDRRKPLTIEERREMEFLHKCLPKYSVDGIDCVQSAGYSRPDSR
jgi:hypothetical protein